MRVADGFLEKAARSSVKHEKDIKRQVLGNEGMARTQAQQLKGKGWKMCLEARKRQHVQKCDLKRKLSGKCLAVRGWSHVQA